MSIGRVGRSLQQLLILLLGATIVLFAVYNQADTTVDVIFTSVTVPTSLLILVPLLAGLILGWVEGRFRRRRARRSRAEREAAAGEAESARREEAADVPGTRGREAGTHGEAADVGAGGTTPGRRDEPGTRPGRESGEDPGPGDTAPGSAPPA